MDTIDAWAGGIIDGEGHVGLHKNNNYHIPVVEVCNTDFRILYRLQAMYGGSLSGPSKPVKDCHSPCKKWYIRGKKVVEFLEIVLPYLVCKREPSRFLLEYAKTIGVTPIDVELRQDILRRYNESK